MRFGIVQREFFGCDDGAYSRVTAREVFDSQITLTGEEVEIVVDNLGTERIHVGNVRSDPAAARQQFALFPAGKSVELNLVFPKPEKSELRLYLKTRVFKPDPEDIWFVFPKGGALHIGSMTEATWRSIGRSDPEDEAYQSEVNGESSGPIYAASSGGIVVRRDPRLAEARFTLVGYKCEVEPQHELFIARATRKPFLEAHHLLPLRYQSQFRRALDFSDNIFALCPSCHRAVHHATLDKTRDIVGRLVTQRPTLLRSLSVNEFAIYRFYNCEEILS